MPTNNVYRFQNTNTAFSKQNSVNEKAKSNGLFKGLPGGKIAIAAALFGVIAAAIFIGLSFLGTRFFGTPKDQIQTAPSVQIQKGANVSNGAVAGVTDVSGIVEGVMPSIVAITEKSTVTSYFGQKYSSQGAGSGFIVKQDDDQLLIVTNNHVVESAEEIKVQFNDGETADAKVQGTSASNDLAVITVSMKNLKDSTKKSIKVANLGSSDDAKVGQMVIAIGNALGYGQSVTVGYLSAKNRELTATDGQNKEVTQVLLQTDAAINPGNSGGALIDTSGRVIGINSSKTFSFGNQNIEGMGYAIPMSKAISIINDLMKREVLKDNEKGYLGVTGRNITKSVSDSYGIPVGVYVVSVSDTGAAYKAGIKQGDVITKINDTTVSTIEEVQEIVNSNKIGTTIKVTVKRSDDGKYKERIVDVTLKSKDTLDKLDDGQDEKQNVPNQNPGGDGGYYGQNPGDDDGSQVFPWGDFGY